jgi:maltooligosyltrehalose trehalohydrolase
MLDFYRRLIRLRRDLPALRHLDKNSLEVSNERSLIFLRRWKEESQTLCILNFDEQEARFRAPISDGDWLKLIDSAEEEWDGPGSTLPEKMKPDQECLIRPSSFALFGLKI